MKNWLYPLWVMVDILVFIAALALWITAPEFKTLNLVLTFFALALAGLLIILKSEEIKIFIKSGYFKTVLHQSINIFLVLSILGILNYLGNKNFREFDLSSQKRNSLTDQTKKVIEIVKAPLKMTLFAKREEWAPMLNLLRLYSAQNHKIKVEAVDTDVRPDLVKKKNITQNGTVVIDYQQKESSFLLFDELSVTNALLKILRTEPVVLYLVKGHQELSCSDSSAEGISFICEKIKSQNYEIRELDLSRITQVPSDATAVLVLGPVSAFFETEVKVLKDYLNRNGNLFLALAPAFKSSLYDNLMEIVTPFGLRLGKDVVLDRISTVQGTEATIPIVDRYQAQHPITENFNLRTVFPLSSSVSVLPGHDSASLLVSTSPFPGSWAETDLEAVSKGKAVFSDKEDTKGPIGLMGISQGVGESTTRIVLIGSSSFLINAYQNQSGNTSLFLNALSWIINDEGIISLNRPGLEEDPVILSSMHLNMIFLISILFVPIIFFAGSIVIYRRRRVL